MHRSGYPVCAQVEMTHEQFNTDSRSDAEGLMMALLLPERMLGGYDGDPGGINGA